MERSSGTVSREDVELQRQAPLDHGYSWIILVAAFMSLLVGGSVVPTCGIFLVEWLDVFGKGQSQTALICSINVGMLSFTGPVAGILTNRFGHRTTVAVGALFLTAGMFLTSFAQQLFHVYISYGIISGIGVGLIYTPSSVVVGSYFLKKRTFAMGIAMIGPSVGTVIFAPLLRQLLNFYGWRGAFVIYSGICLNCLVFAALLRPVEYWDSKNITKKTSSKTLINASLFKDAVFLIFCMQSFLTSFHLSYFHFLPDFAKDSGIDKSKSAILLSVIGFISIFSRLGSAIIGNHRRISVIHLFSASLALEAIAIFLLPLNSNFVYLVFTVVVFGCAFGAYQALSPSTVAKLFGTERLASAYGYSVFVRGFAGCIGSTLFGKVREVTGSYSVSFYSIGSCMAISTLLMVVIIIVLNRRSRLDKSKAADDGIQQNTHI